jgi:hypothetical protein
MLIKIYTSDNKYSCKAGKLIDFICDNCGDKFTRFYSVVVKGGKMPVNNFCCNQCKADAIKAGKVKYEYNHRAVDESKCMICNKHKDDTFYDKGIYTGRVLCSTDCRDKYYDSRTQDLVDKDYEIKTGYTNKYKNKKHNYSFYKQGKITLDYNLSRISI